jgi:2-succinyl-5-enolpyruvyl-6-hydroxy-3-cyclohexene-1-carboxylate synthase
MKNPLVILGDIPERERATVKDVLLKLHRPIYAESHSGLREDSDLRGFILRSGDRIFSSSKVLECFDSVIRIGGVPTVRFWRDLEDKFHHWPVLAVHNVPWSGLARDKNPALSYADGLREIMRTVAPAKAPSLALVHDVNFREQLEGLLDKFYLSEPSMVAQISQNLPDGARVFVGNSLPIREWDLAADYRRNFSVASNRGLNGIDGLVSTFLGWSLPGVENVLILGDLSALYDLNGLWPLTQGIVKNNCKIIVINNGGGRIFHRMFNKNGRDSSIFENPHKINFASWADMFGLKYARFSGGQWPEISGSAVIEVVPENLQTELFFDHYEEIFGAGSVSDTSRGASK